MKKLFALALLVITLYGCRSHDQAAELNSTDPAKTLYKEAHRPQLHFSPKEKWMNDPNGMVFHNGEYHLFYQHHPNGLTWGPMHWGHAISKDLVHWEHLPIALYPDSLGLIFSGSAVLDKNNTSGFGTIENPPLVAIFTYHSQQKEKAGRKDYQYQGIAYSTDNGRTWTKYAQNPVLKNQGVPDFRDPKVFWHEATKKWVMILAVKDHVELWSSPDIKSWTKLSDFGFEYGGHGGVWECPDLFAIKPEGESNEKWVMIVSINPGGPNGGSATQYFVGNFDGKTFTCDTDKNTTTWLDHGPDNYAGVTYFNAPDNRKIFLGWMSNWAYAEAVPTSPWRSANTLPRDLSLTKIDNRYYVRSVLSPETSKLVGDVIQMGTIVVNDTVTLDGNFDASSSQVSASLPVKDFSVTLFNEAGEKLVIGFDQAKNAYYIDRSRSGKNQFSQNFRGRLEAPRVSTADKINFTFVSDVSSVEVFFDDGLSVMTSLFFPDKPLNRIKLSSKEAVSFGNVSVKKLNCIWEQTK